MIFQNFRFSPMVESMSSLQHVCLHAPLLHPVWVGSAHPSSNDGTMKLIISIRNHTYQMFSLAINSLAFFANFACQICPLITLAISLCDDKRETYRANQVTLISPHPNLFHTFTILASFVHFCDDHDACTLFH